MLKLLLKITFIIIFIHFNNSCFSQFLFSTSKGKISFFSKAPLEDIEAKNNDVSSVINVETGEIRFKVPVKKFFFSNRTMQEHFNENYLETEKFPFAEFKGRIMDFTNIKLNADGNFNVTITGDLSIHGKTQKVTHKGNIIRSGDVINATADFKIKIADYDIEIPTIVIKNIAEIVDVKVNMSYSKIKK